MIDGNVMLRPWGTHSFQLEPGMHNVRIYFRYLFMEMCGPAAANVVVQPNCVHRLKYEMGIFMFSAGSMRELPPFRFTLRYARLWCADFCRVVKKHGGGMRTDA